MVTKRGLSDIVSNVLIILLVLVAIGILWLFLRPTITKAGNVGGAADCFAVDLTVAKCDAATGDITVTRGAGGPKDLLAVKLVADSPLGTSGVQTNYTLLPAELQTVLYKAVAPGQTYASVAGVIKSTDLNGTVCSVSQKVKCA